MMGEKLPQLKDALRMAKMPDADIASAIAKAKQGKFDEKIAAAIIRFKHELFPELMNAAARLNEEGNKKQIEFYAVSYISDKCVNDCSYCGHRNSIGVERETLSLGEMALDFASRLRFGPTEICILAGQHPSITVEFLGKAGKVAIEQDVHDALKSVCFNVAPMGVEQYKILKDSLSKETQIRVFQESYDEKTYLANHPCGPKRNFEFRLGSQERAMEAGIKLVGVGALMGINEENSPWLHFGHDFEIMAMLAHSFHLREKFGSFPATASIPRHQKSDGSDFATPNRLDDIRYALYHAIMRIFLPDTKIIVTNREREEMRDLLRPMINIEDLAARPGVGGNFRADAHMQNELGDKSGPQEIIDHIGKKGFFPVLGGG